MILPCDCKHEAQDRLHGKGMRVHNEMKPSIGGKREARCTVCLKTKAVKGSA